MQSSSSMGRKRSHWRRYLVWYAFIAPNVILFAIFGLLPIIATVLISFTRWNVLGTPTWVGLQNFQRLLQDDEFWTTLRVTATYAILFVLPSAAIALGQAMLVAIAGRAQALFRTIYFIPVVTSITVIAMIWGWFFLPDENGPLNYLIGLVGIPPQSWLQSLTQALPSVTLVAIWSGVGYYMVLWLSGLQGIPQELLDAAMVDGANAWTRFWRVTLPLLRPTTMFIIVIGTINAFQAFALFYLLTGGGPLYETTTIVMFIYKNAFRLQEMGYASAASMILVLVTLITTLIQRRAIGGWSDELYS